MLACVRACVRSCSYVRAVGHLFAGRVSLLLALGLHLLGMNGFILVSFSFQFCHSLVYFLFHCFFCFSDKLASVSCRAHVT